MKRAEYLKVIREHLHDPEGKVWSDEELDRLLDAAAEAYSSDTRMFRAAAKIFPTESEFERNTPENHLAFYAGWNGRGMPLKLTTERELMAEDAEYGVRRSDCEEYVYEPRGTIGRLCFYPALSADACISYHPDFPYGVVHCFSGRGLPSGSTEYGIPTGVKIYPDYGEYIYIYAGDPEEVPDYRSLVYYVCYEAYLADGEFQNRSRAEFYFSEYRRRVKRYIVRVSGVEKKRRGGCYY